VRNKPNLAANRAKRTQFLVADTPHHSNIPLFQRSNAMAIVQNEANLRGVSRLKRQV